MDKLEREMRDTVKEMQRNFELYKDKVTELDAICDAYSKLLTQEKEESLTLRQKLLRVESLVNSKASLDQIAEVLQGLKH